MAIITQKIGTLEYLAAEGIAVPHCFTTRLGGVSGGHLESLNIAFHRGIPGKMWRKTTEFWQMRWILTPKTS